MPLAFVRFKFFINLSSAFINELRVKQEIVFKKDKATLHVISKRCEDTVNYSN